MTPRYRSSTYPSDSATASPSTTSRSRLDAARCSGSSAPTAPARRRPCGRSARLIAPTSGSATVAGYPLTPENGVGDPPADRDHARVAGPVPAPQRVREPRVLRRPVRGGRPARSHRARARARSTSPTGPSDACGTLSKGLRQRVALARALLSDPGGAVPRRADVGPRPGRRSRGPRADRRPPQARRHDLPHHAPARGGGAPLRPRRDPQYDPAHDRPTRRAARPAVRHGRSR